MADDLPENKSNRMRQGLSAGQGLPISIARYGDPDPPDHPYECWHYALVRILIADNAGDDDKRKQCHRGDFRDAKGPAVTQRAADWFRDGQSRIGVILRPGADKKSDQDKRQGHGHRAADHEQPYRDRQFVARAERVRLGGMGPAECDNSERGRHRSAAGYATRRSGRVHFGWTSMWPSAQVAVLPTAAAAPRT